MEMKRCGRPALDVLLVDDCVPFLEALARRARSESSIRLRTAMSDETARRALARRAPDVLVCDFTLGDASGLVLLDEVARQQQKVRRILLSGWPARTFELALARGTVHAVLSKPLSFADFLAAVHGYDGAELELQSQAS
jgi:ActR/RegA family two-component response regulator